jgi:hypothetical protein
VLICQRIRHRGFATIAYHVFDVEVHNPKVIDTSLM